MLEGLCGECNPLEKKKKKSVSLISISPSAVLLALQSNP